MKSLTTERYRKCFARLPREIKRAARSAFRKWRDDPTHPSLHFKRVHRKQNVYSVRIADGGRALGIRDRDRIAWFCIGAHDVYERLLSNM